MDSVENNDKEKIFVKMWCNASHLLLVPLLSLLPGASGHVGILVLHTLDDLIHVQCAFAVVRYNHCLVLDLRLQLLDLLQGADTSTRS